MTLVHTTGGQTADLDDYDSRDTVGELAAAIARDAHDGNVSEDAVFSLKVNGVVLDPTLSSGGASFAEDTVVELVDVTAGVPDQTEQGPRGFVSLEETGTLVATDVPTGTVDEVIDWVGDDVARAKSALAAEYASDDPRVTLVTHLERVIPDADDAE